MAVAFLISVWYRTPILNCMNFSPVNIAERKKIDIRPGDTVRVWQKIQEKDKTRLQAFQGLVLARKRGTEPGATFTVRKIASGVGVEKIFPFFSPLIDKIEILRRSNPRRSKLYYIRTKTAKEIKRKMRGLAEFVPVVHTNVPAEELEREKEGGAPAASAENTDVAVESSKN